jgi:orotidine-5'-phosphate decarboxylase
MNDAKDKLIVALDLDHASRALQLQAALSEWVGTFKIGMQLFTAAGPELVRQIVSRGSRVFLDLKYHDIPNTVARAAIEATRLGVSMFNIHAAGGREMMMRAADAVAEASAREGLAKPTVLGVTLLTSADQETLHQLGISDGPAQVVRRLAALAKSSTLDGVVASAHEINIIRDEVSDPEFVIVCPGMRSTQDASNDQRRTMSVTDAIRAGADYVVVGRPILNADDPEKAALSFHQEIGQAMMNAAAINQVSAKAEQKSPHRVQ